ncbi:hypothetical protein [Pedobacter steynii]|uniref:Uncharacterized protein n=1 Tax=Pedobacter steynii TaxID=430522 RepID=A0A1D7QI38_9SPHI|nr:hypothetical protein [Pedobacter steynii]AOM78346.1 hypothetical protein BFS30_14870 [Pedobacter steynii]
MDVHNIEKKDFLKWSPAPFNRWFGVAFDFITAERQSRVSFEVHVENVGVLSDGSYHFRVNRDKHIFIDDYEPDLVIDEIAVKCSEFIYPLDIQVSAEGVWTGRTIHAELIKRWPDFKQKMLDEYNGGYIVHYLNKMEENVLDHKKFSKALEKDLFLTLFFRSTAAIFRQKEPVKTSLFPLVPTETAFYYEITAEINVEEDRITAKLRGNLDPDTPVFVYSTIPTQTELEINYVIDPELNQIRTIWGSGFAELKTGRMETRFSAFHIKDRDVAVEMTENKADRTLYYLG